MAEIVEHLFQQSLLHSEQIGSDNRRTQKLVEDSVRRVEDKVQAQLDSNGTTLQSFFKQTNDKLSQLESDANNLKLATETKTEELERELGRRVSEQSLKATLASH